MEAMNPMLFHKVWCNTKLIFPVLKMFIVNCHTRNFWCHCSRGSSVSFTDITLLEISGITRLLLLSITIACITSCHDPFQNVRDKKVFLFMSMMMIMMMINHIMEYLIFDDQSYFGKNRYYQRDVYIVM